MNATSERLSDGERIYTLKMRPRELWAIMTIFVIGVAFVVRQNMRLDQVADMVGEQRSELREMQKDFSSMRELLAQIRGEMKRGG